MSNILLQINPRLYIIFTLIKNRTRDFVSELFSLKCKRTIYDCSTKFQKFMKSKIFFIQL